MITEDKLPALTQFLFEKCATEEDHHTCEDIITTFRALFRVLAVGRVMVNKPPALYSPNSRKGQMQEAIKPFKGIEIKELHD